MTKNFTVKWTKKLCPVLLALSLTTSTLGGTVLAADSAAASPEAVQAAGANKAGYGILALGALALLATHSHDSASTVSSGGKAATAGVESGAASQGSSTGQAGAATGTKTSTTASVAAAEQQAVSLMNADRRSQGLPALKVDSKLTILGEKYAQDMVNRHYFSHTNPEGQSPFDRMKAAGISYTSAGENIAINQSVPAAETAFMNSSGHRANILNSSYTNVGIGVAYDSSGDVYVVQEFIGK